MDLINNIINWIEANMPAFIATSGTLITAIGSVIIIIRRGKEFFGIGNTLVNNVVKAFNNKTDDFANSMKAAFDQMKIEFFAAVQDMRNDYQTIMEMVADIMLVKSVPTAVKKDVLAKAEKLKSADLKKYVTEKIKTDPPVSQTIQLAEVKEVKPLSDNANGKPDSKADKKSSVYIPTSE